MRGEQSGRLRFKWFNTEAAERESRSQPRSSRTNHTQPRSWAQRHSCGTRTHRTAAGPKRALSRNPDPAVSHAQPQIRKPGGLGLGSGLGLGLGLGLGTLTLTFALTLTMILALG